MKTLILIILLTFPVIAQIDNSNFERIFRKETIAEKKDIWSTLSKAEQNEVRRQNFNWVASRIAFNNEQQNYLNHFAPTNDNKDALQTEAIRLFTKTEGILLFGTIGPFRNCDPFMQTSYQPVGCRCSFGSKFNMSCSGDCFQTTTCTVSVEGCGFAWLYKCDSWCAYS